MSWTCAMPFTSIMSKPASLVDHPEFVRLIEIEVVFGRLMRLRPVEVVAVASDLDHGAVLRLGADGDAQIATRSTSYSPSLSSGSGLTA